MTPHITVCVCTFRRPELLRRLLTVLQQQRTDGRFTFSIVVTDNDSNASALETVETVATGSKVEVLYTHEPRRNIALARNESLRHAGGDYAAFIDDDEFPADDWLTTMLDACERFDAAGVLGPVRPHFDQPPPAWIVKGRFCERSEHATGHVLQWTDCRTGNVLFRRSILGGDDEPFRPRFGQGGEDSDFFLRMIDAGRVFRWCNEGLVYETVPQERLSSAYMLKRALLRGSLSMGLPGSHAGFIAKAMVAVPAYALTIPVATLFGTHVSMKYCIRLCDHAGVLLTALGFQPVRER